MSEENQEPKSDLPPETSEFKTDHTGITFETYKVFDGPNLVLLLTGLLDENEVEYKILADGTEVDNPHSHAAREYQIQVKSDQKEFIDELIEERSNQELNSVDQDYFIFEYSDYELRDILRNANEWSPLDIALSQKILKERGKEVTKEEIAEWREERKAKESAPKEAKKSSIVICYICAVIFPIIGIIAGLVYTLSKKSNNEGDRLHSYTPQTRTHGRNMIIVAFVVALTAIVVGSLFAD